MRKDLFLYVVFIFFSIPSFTAGQAILPSEKSSNASYSPLKTKILILATTHLSQVEEDFSPNLLDSLISVLAKYNPTIIGVEQLSGNQIAHMQLQSHIYNSVIANSVLSRGKKVQDNLNMTWQETNMKVEAILTQTQHIKRIKDNTRLELIRYLLASYRPVTAGLQWSYISKQRRTSQEVIPKETVAFLNALLQIANEISSIGIRLAHKLGLQRVYPIDDFMARDYYNKIEEQIKKALTDSIDKITFNATYLQKSQRLLKQGLKNKNLYPLYEYMNSPAYYKNDYKIQWRNTFLITDKFQKVLGKRLALWQVRNLNIAANIRKASAHSTGGRVLIIIGGSHKAFLDKYFKDMMGIKVVNLDDIVGK